MKPIQTVLAAFFLAHLVILSGCQDGGAFVPTIDTEGPSDDTPVENTSGSEDCTYQLNGDVRSPTRLVDTGAACDYRLRGWVTVSSDLIVDPGVVVRADADARLVVDGGGIQAVGTADQRIVFEGASHVAGSWVGFRFRSGRASRFDFVDIRDAGQNCTSFSCPDGAMTIDGVDFTFMNSTVSNSDSLGMGVTDDAVLSNFSNNRFFGNRGAAMVIHNSRIPELDNDSDYLGLDDPNGLPYVIVGIGSLDASGERLRWKSLNVPYYLPRTFWIKYGTLHLEAGVEMVFGAGERLEVQGGGGLVADGSVENPVVFRGLDSEPGRWSGIYFNDSTWSGNRLSHTYIRDGGGPNFAGNAWAALTFDESVMALDHVTITGNAGRAIGCREEDYPVWAASVITIVGNLLSFDNGNDLIDSDCQLVQ